ncbi:hypothetical protein M2G40_21795 [Vibrio vulnificus]|nr:hypothetical protein [Vibrio vulnificus]MCU8492320.1 hypothetical protein [Vibrio vulnificus]MCU8510418.1 hypothetical protein [Vibrio vulnificus]
MNFVVKVVCGKLV